MKRTRERRQGRAHDEKQNEWTPAAETGPGTVTQPAWTWGSHNGRGERTFDRLSGGDPIMEETEPGKPAPGSSQRPGREKGYFLSESSSRAMDAVGFLRRRERGSSPTWEAEKLERLEGVCLSKRPRREDKCVRMSGTARYRERVRASNLHDAVPGCDCDLPGSRVWLNPTGLFSNWYS